MKKIYRWENDGFISFMERGWRVWEDVEPFMKTCFDTVYLYNGEEAVELPYQYDLRTLFVEVFERMSDGGHDVLVLTF